MTAKIYNQTYTNFNSKSKKIETLNFVCPKLQ